jgi:hypothetical protein
VELNVLQVVADFHGNAWVPNLQISVLLFLLTATMLDVGMA